MSASATHQRELDALTVVLGEEPRAVRLIRQNKYCRIYRVELERGPLIVKRYIAGKPSLERSEARALELYEGLAETVPGLLAGRLEAFDADTRTVAMTFLPGELMSSVLRRASSDRAASRRCVEAMETIGRALVALRTTTVKGSDTPDPFLLEYLSHVTAGLRRIPLLGPRLVRGPEPRELFEAMVDTGEPPSFSHGDLVFANVLIHGSQVGLIDFANTLDRAHLLNDLCGLQIALDAKPMPRGLRAELNGALRRTVGDQAQAPRPVREFYRELHRRRWLYLQLRESGPRGVAGVLRSWSRLRKWARR